MAELTSGSSARKRSAPTGQDLNAKLPKLHLQWLLKLENRKNIVRVEMPNEEDGTHKMDVFPKSITQQRPVVSHYTLKNSIKDLVDVNYQLRGKFPSWTSITKNLDIDWTELESVIREADYRKDLNMVDKTKWKAHGPEREFMSDMGHMNDIWGFLRLAFATGFENGEIKALIRSVCNHVIKEMNSVRLLVESPPPNSLLVSRVLPVDEHEFEEEGSSLDSNAYPVESEKRGGVVPDVLVYHPTLPLFLLSVECKKACDDDDRGIVQCLHQMFSHMHYQDLHFGFWINPHKWRLMVVHKNEEDHTISVMQEEESLLIRSNCKTFNTFNVDSLFRLFKWIHKALAFECSRIATEG